MIEYRPTPGSDWVWFSDGQIDAESLDRANHAVGYEKYRIGQPRHVSTFGEVE